MIDEMNDAFATNTMTVSDKIDCHCYSFF